MNRTHLAIGYFINSVCMIVAISCLAAASFAEEMNRPVDLVSDIIITNFPDALHIQLNDGRMFRLAYVVAPDPQAAEYQEAKSLVPKVFQAWKLSKAGIRIVGKNPAGEILIEPWVYAPEMVTCGNATVEDRKQMAIPRWRNQTWLLVSSGLFWLEKGIKHETQLTTQRFAMVQGTGIWKHPEYVRRLCDLKFLESELKKPTDPWGPTVRDERLFAARMLLRANREIYVGKLMAVVTDPQENDVFVRTRVAQLLDESGYKQGTKYLMNALRNSDGTGLDQYQLNSVVREYQGFWRAYGSSPGDRVSLLKYYDEH